MAKILGDLEVCGNVSANNYPPAIDDPSFDIVTAVALVPGKYVSPYSTVPGSSLDINNRLRLADASLMQPAVGFVKKTYAIGDTAEVFPTSVENIYVPDHPAGTIVRLHTEGDFTNSNLTLNAAENPYLLQVLGTYTGFKKVRGLDLEHIQVIHAGKSRYRATVADHFAIIPQGYNQVPVELLSSPKNISNDITVPDNYTLQLFEPRIGGGIQIRLGSNSTLRVA